MVVAVEVEHPVHSYVLHDHHHSSVRYKAIAIVEQVGDRTDKANE